MSQTDVGAPVHLPPAPDVPGPNRPEDFAPAVPPGLLSPAQELGLPEQPKTTDQVQREINKASQSPAPELEQTGSSLVYLPGGYLRDDGHLVMSAQVRELNGFDEERLSRLIMADNPAVYVTEMLTLGTEDLDGQKPTKDDIRNLLIGDRTALWLGIRIVTYGPTIEYTLTCVECETENKPTVSIVEIDLNDDIPVKKLDDPTKQTYEVELRHGVAKVKLLDGFAQEKFSTNLGKKTQAEVNTIMLANSVTEINGIKTQGREDAVRALSSQDRGTLMDFIAEKQPGPDLDAEIEAHCSKCNATYPIVLSPASMFRF